MATPLLGAPLSVGTGEFLDISKKFIIKIPNRELYYNQTTTIPRPERRVDIVLVKCFVRKLYTLLFVNLLPFCSVNI
jgi:hypothetical protein